MTVYDFKVTNIDGSEVTLADRSAIVATGVGAFVAAPLIRDGSGPARTDSARRRHRDGRRASTRHHGASGRSYGSLDRRPHGRVENHLRQDCAPAGTNTAGESGSQRRRHPSRRPGRQTHRIERRSAKDALRHRIRHGSFRSCQTCFTTRRSSRTTAAPCRSPRQSRSRRTI